MWELRLCFPWGLLDGLAHRLHLPGFIQRPLCDRFDRALGFEDEPETASQSEGV